MNYQPGDRVVIKGHGGFADGIMGTIAMPEEFQLYMAGPGEWQGCRRSVMTPKGLREFYYVQFDEPHDDGSGDGPYRAAEMLAEYLRPAVL
ncbi:MAG: hypothetical protein ACYTF1_20685 [Planctomycetota bacterium]